MSARRRNRLVAARLDRRQFLTRAGIFAGAVAVGPGILAACGDDDDNGGSGGGGGGGDGSFKLATWVYYIDGDDANPQDAATIKKFTADTGITVDYTVDVDDNVTFTAAVQPKLESGESIGYDLVVLTSWMCDRWIREGWAEPLDAALLPNKSNMLARHADPSWDPGRKYTLPWAEGQVGVAYYPDEVGFEMKDVKDLLDPRVKGKVTILSEMRDTLGSFMLSEGVDPSTASVDEALGVLEIIERARDDGQFRKITGNSYTDDLSARDAVAALAWSGDVVSLQAEQPDLLWVAPAAGQMSFVDTFMVPKGAANVEQAHAWMNYVYDPAVSGPLFEFISYVSPVDGAVEEMSQAAQDDPLINPPADAKLYEFRTLSQDEADDLENAFAQATQL
jgi:spermidine/putrescine transport system substrate-binding protein